ncbi:MAG TPA: lysophospholipid acyltransferase family protein [Nitrospinota bacterium]|nr:lysophospholipid acyltransferase family protein [Nitrospinota bacterium]MDP7503069.1 lysophospholipid acyltransferase family protein [Nitrospinota bacterium]MDP7664722.1 lysophospholipid acyltransferase family protein [Nitrospinota bacterium]HJP13795.1 lysophospholipid acyltransferase family protein [Nitrospinota bacterium]
MSPSPARASNPRKKRRRSKDKSPLRQNAEFLLVYAILSLVRWMPLWLCGGAASLAGSAIYTLAPRRRKILLTNLGIAFPGLSGDERAQMARASCRSFALTGLESVKYLYRFRLESAEADVRRMVEGVDDIFARARRLHDEAGGCIFVVPHLGNWELIAHGATLASIPVTIVVRPLDNPWLEKHLFEMRSGSGQEILAKRNALFHLRTALRKGRSVGLLADQHAGMKGIDVPFFGKPASTTTGPAALAITFGRPIMVVACLRKPGGREYEVLLSDPIHPDTDADSVGEIERLTAAVNREIEGFIRQRPDQYFWLHDRWKLAKLWGRSESFLAEREKTETEDEADG